MDKSTKLINAVWRKIHQEMAVNFLYHLLLLLRKLYVFFYIICISLNNVNCLPHFDSKDSFYT